MNVSVILQIAIIAILTYAAWCLHRIANKNDASLEVAFLIASQGAKLVVMEVSSTVTWLVCDFIPGKRYRGVKTLEELRDAASKFIDDERVVMHGAEPFGLYRARGISLYEGVALRHTPLHG